MRRATMRRATRRIALVADSLPVVVYAPALAMTMEVLMVIIVGTVGRRGGFNQIELQAGVMLEFLIWHFTRNNGI